VAIVALWLILFAAHALFHCFWRGNLKTAVRKAIHFESEVDQNPDRRALPNSFHESQHRSLLRNGVVAGPFPHRSENRSQAVVFKFLRQDITVVIAERKKGTPPLEVSEMRSNADRRAALLRSQDCLKCVRILE
jgi:hypothetical protein